MTPSPSRPGPPAPGVPADDPARGRALLAAGEWARAREAFLAAGPDDAAAAEGAAQASWWLDDGAACLEERERAYRLHRSAGDLLGAARAATALGYDAALFGQGAAVASGWLGRARDLLATTPGPTPEHGWLAVREAELALQVTHRPDVAREAASRAVDLGRALGDAGLQSVALGLLGLADVLAGHLQVGMDRLDTAVVSALAGDVTDLMWVGKTCCWLVAACQGAQDLPRALQWCARVDALCRDRDLAPLFTACRIQYASVRLASGQWAEAEAELVGALQRMQGSLRSTRTDAVVQLGHLRRRQGRLEEADELYRQAGFAPQAVVGRALLRLARGDTAGAWALASTVLDEIARDDALGRGSVLLPVARCALAAGRDDAAAAAASELRGPRGGDGLRVAAGDRGGGGGARRRRCRRRLRGRGLAQRGTVLPPGGPAGGRGRRQARAGGGPRRRGPGRRGGGDPGRGRLARAGRRSRTARPGTGGTHPQDGVLGTNRRSSRGPDRP